MDCKICGLLMTENAITRHHLIPRQMKYKGKYGVPNKTIKVHRLCHAMVHIFFDNAELATKYNTREKLKSNKVVQRYTHFIRNQLNPYYLNSDFALSETKKIKEIILNICIDINKDA